MEQSEKLNGTSEKRPVLFSISSYNERYSKPVINKLLKVNPFQTATEPPPPLRDPSRGINGRNRPLSLCAVATAVTTTQNLYASLPRPERPLSYQAASPQQNGTNDTNKPDQPPKLVERLLSLEPDQLKQSGKVALTIAAYEGETKAPTRLDFLPSILSNTNSKSNDSPDSSSTYSSTPVSAVDEEVREIGSRLQDELVATLRKSNLREIHDSKKLNGDVDSDNTLKDDEMPPVPPTPEPSPIDNVISNALSPTEEEINVIESLDSIIENETKEFEVSILSEIDQTVELKEVQGEEVKEVNEPAKTFQKKSNDSESENIKETEHENSIVNESAIIIESTIEPFVEVHQTETTEINKVIQQSNEVSNDANDIVSNKIETNTNENTHDNIEKTTQAIIEPIPKDKVNTIIEQELLVRNTETLTDEVKIAEENVSSEEKKSDIVEKILENTSVIDQSILREKDMKTIIIENNDSHKKNENNGHMKKPVAYGISASHENGENLDIMD
ncbi:hypothetical protein TKK_0015957 [Trichogramma kaykai]|uniref:Uncharacterized protein n=1 Tax=Trichogramma kaykai TaxID=54128 RepID=A0ABD2W958_9HYME